MKRMALRRRLSTRMLIALITILPAMAGPARASDLPWHSTWVGHGPNAVSAKLLAAPGVSWRLTVEHEAANATQWTEIRWTRSATQLTHGAFGKDTAAARVVTSRVATDDASSAAPPAPWSIEGSGPFQFVIAFGSDDPAARTTIELFAASPFGIDDSGKSPGLFLRGDQIPAYVEASAGGTSTRLLGGAEATYEARDRVFAYFDPGDGAPAPCGTTGQAAFVCGPGGPQPALVTNGVPGQYRFGALLAASSALTQSAGVGSVLAVDVYVAD